MSDTQRKEFLKKLGILSLGAALIPQMLQAKSGPLASCTNQPALDKNTLYDSAADFKDENDFGLIDLHCHPSLKMYLWDRRMWHHHTPLAGDNALAMQVDIFRLEAGKVRGFMATHYLPERGMKEEMKTAKTLSPLLAYLAPTLLAQLEKGGRTTFRQLETMMDQFEYQIDHLREDHCLLKQQKILISRNFAEYEKSIQEGNITIAHAIEGAHALGRDLTIDEYKTNLGILKRRGVCMITLSHFFANNISFPVEGMAPNEKEGSDLEWRYRPEVNDVRLTEIGSQVVDWMLENGMVVDLTHAPPATRTQVFEKLAVFNSKRRADTPHLSLRPVIFSHTGAQGIFNQHTKKYADRHLEDLKYQNGFHDFGYYDVSDDEIQCIEACGGVIGVIAENFWLVGGNTSMLLKGYDPCHFWNGIDYMIETMIYINSRTEKKNFDNVGIGTDFDGFADSLHDLKSPARLPALKKRMAEKMITENGVERRAITDEQIKKIMHGNAMRVLRNGWGN